MVEEKAERLSTRVVGCNGPLQHKLSIVWNMEVKHDIFASLLPWSTKHCDKQLWMESLFLYLMQNSPKKRPKMWSVRISRVLWLCRSWYYIFHVVQRDYSSNVGLQRWKHKLFPKVLINGAFIDDFHWIFVSARLTCNNNRQITFVSEFCTFNSTKRKPVLKYSPVLIIKLMWAAAELINHPGCNKSTPISILGRSHDLGPWIILLFARTVRVEVSSRILQALLSALWLWIRRAIESECRQRVPPLFKSRENK